jgi:hypothetical protein
MMGTGDGEIWQSCLASPPLTIYVARLAKSSVDRQTHSETETRHRSESYLNRAVVKLNKFLPVKFSRTERSMLVIATDLSATRAMMEGWKRQGRAVGY